MPKNVLTMPGGDSSRYTHQYGVYSIQLHRNTVMEPLCQDPNQYFALRESGGGAMLWLYQVVSAPGLVLDPKKPLPDQIKKWQEGLRSDQKIPVSQQINVSRYISAVTRNLGADYRKEQLFYVLGSLQNRGTGEDGLALPPHPLIHKPKPFENNQRPMSYPLEDILKKRVLR